MKYGLDSRMKIIPLLMYGLQWWVVSVPSIIVMGLVVAKLHFGENMAEQTIYMQKLFGIMGAAIFIQVLWGHRLPLVIGPASVLLIGILASSSAGIAAIYTSIILGGGLMAIISFSGLLRHLQNIFTPRIIAVILLMVDITLSPVIINLVFSGGSSPLFNLFFALVYVVVLIATNHFLKGIWKSTTLVWGIVIGAVIYFIFNGFPRVEVVSFSTAAKEFTFFYPLEFDAGVITAFVFCALALVVNELGSIQAVGHLLEAKDMSKRTTRGVGITGVMNMVSGSIGIIGPVDYSTSPGIIAASGCASRYPLIPTAIGLLLCAFLPAVVSTLLYIPGVVMGALLLYIMSSQLAASLQLIVRDKAVMDYQDGVTIGLPVMVALMISFAPAHVLDLLPPVIRPVLGNGFVIGVIMVFILEHVIFRKRRKA